MKNFIILFLFLASTLALGDTPPPGTVKAKVYSGDGNTAITATGSSLNVSAVPQTPTAIALRQSAVTIGTSAIRLTTNGGAPSVSRVLLAAQLLSTSSANCYLGASSVANSGANRGVQMLAGALFAFNNDAGDYYAICDTSSQTFFITEQ